MYEAYQWMLSIILLVLGIPIGNLLAKSTKEELKSGRKYFNLLIILNLIGTIIFLILGNNALMLTFSFIAVVASRSLKK